MLTLLLIFLALLLHEVGHLIAALILKVPIQEFNILGYVHSPIFSFNIKNIPITIGFFPSGFVNCNVKYITQHIVIAAAGPAMSALLALIFFKTDFCIINFVIFCITFLPILDSDGKKIINALQEDAFLFGFIKNKQLELHQYIFVDKNKKWHIVDDITKATRFNFIEQALLYHKFKRSKNKQQSFSYKHESLNGRLIQMELMLHND